MSFKESFEQSEFDYYVYCNQQGQCELIDREAAADSAEFIEPVRQYITDEGETAVLHEEYVTLPQNWLIAKDGTRRVFIVFDHPVSMENVPDDLFERIEALI